MQYADDGEGLKALQGFAEIIDAASNVIIMGTLPPRARRFAKQDDCHFPVKMEDILPVKMMAPNKMLDMCQRRWLSLHGSVCDAIEHGLPVFCRRC